MVTRTEKIALAPVPADRHLVLHQALRAGLRTGEHVLELGHDSVAACPSASACDWPIRLSADRLRMLMRPCRIDADHAGAGARQHRFGEAAAAVDQIVRVRVMSSRWVRSSEVILLNVSPSWARSPSERRIGTRT